MQKVLHPERIAAVYECLRSFPPFSRWNLPTSDEIEFRTPARDGDSQAYYNCLKDGRHVIAVITGGVESWYMLCWLMAHEMIHLHQQLRKCNPRKTQHNAEFKRLATQVCARFGWTLSDFMGG